MKLSTLIHICVFVFLFLNLSVCSNPKINYFSGGYQHNHTQPNHWLPKFPHHVNKNPFSHPIFGGRFSNMFKHKCPHTPNPCCIKHPVPIEFKLPIPDNNTCVGFFKPGPFTKPREPPCIEGVKEEEKENWLMNIKYEPTCEKTYCNCE